MERINKVSLAGKTPDEALPLIEKWMNDTADRINYTLTHLDENNFIEGRRPLTQEAAQEQLSELWEDVKKIVINN